MSKMFELVRPHCAGIDVGSTRHYVAVPQVAGKDEVRNFGCFTRDLLEIGRWLLSLGVEDVAMEATGVYWVPVYEALATMGLKVVLVDGRAAKALPGRKTDVQDCQWIRDLHMYGLVKPCSVPDAGALEIRAYWRLRARLVEQRSEQIQLMHKALEQMNVQLHKVLRDVSGVSGLAIIRAMLAGQRDPKILASLVKGPVKNDQETFIRALEGTWAQHHLFTLGDAVAQYDFLGGRMMECDARLDEAMRKMAGVKPPPDAPGPRRRKNQPHFDLKGRLEEVLGVDATRIDGLDAMTVATLFSEYGKDLSLFPTEKHFTSHLGLCPNNRVTGGKRKSGRTRKVCSRSAKSLRLAAQSLHRNDSALGAFYRRLKAKQGPSKATTATARKIAVYYYRLVVHGEVYEDVGADAYEQDIKEQRIRNLKRQAKRLGMDLVEAA
jgi:transposase